MRQLPATVIASLLVSGCGQATAATVNPADDVHCSTLAFYFQGLAKHHQAPLVQQRAITGMHEWYAAKLREVAAARWKEKSEAEAEIGPILEKIKSDPLAMRDAMKECALRAQREPTFNAFARAQGF